MNDDIFEQELYIEPPPPELILTVRRGSSTLGRDFLEFLVGLVTIVYVLWLAVDIIL